MDRLEVFRFDDKAVDGHLWVIISDPVVDEGRVLFVSMTSYDITKERVCILDLADHPFIKHKTCIAYEFAKVAPLQTLAMLRDQGHLAMNQPVAIQILERTSGKCRKLG